MAKKIKAGSTKELRRSLRIREDMIRDRHPTLPEKEVRKKAKEGQQRLLDKRVERREFRKGGGRGGGAAELVFDKRLGQFVRRKTLK